MTLNPLLQTMEAGSAAFAARWRAWVSQYTQPQLLNLSREYLGASLFHSSTMTGFASRKLRRPAPHTFLAIGYLNTAHGRSLGIPEESIQEVVDIGLPKKLPDALKATWEGREPFSDANRLVLGPVGLFEAFTGLRALSEATNRTIAPDDEEAVCAALGRFLRLQLSSLGTDWYSELPTIRSQSQAMADLLMGTTVPGDRVLQHLNTMARIAETTEDELWELVGSHLSS